MGKWASIFDSYFYLWYWSIYLLVITQFGGSCYSCEGSESNYQSKIGGIGKESKRVKKNNVEMRLVPSLEIIEEADADASGNTGETILMSSVRHPFWKPCLLTLTRNDDVLVITGTVSIHMFEVFATCTSRYGGDLLPSTCCNQMFLSNSTVTRIHNVFSRNLRTIASSSFPQPRSYTAAVSLSNRWNRLHWNIRHITTPLQAPQPHSVS